MALEETKNVGVEDVSVEPTGTDILRADPHVKSVTFPPARTLPEQYGYSRFLRTDTSEHTAADLRQAETMKAILVRFLTEYPTIVDDFSEHQGTPGSDTDETMLEKGNSRRAWEAQMFKHHGIPVTALLGKNKLNFGKLLSVNNAVLEFARLAEAAGHAEVARTFKEKATCIPHHIESYDAMPIQAKLRAVEVADETITEILSEIVR